MSDAVGHIPDSNYWHYALQLNIYKYILNKNYNMLITSLYIIVLHPDNKNYLRIEMPNLQSELIELFKYNEETKNS